MSRQSLQKAGPAASSVPTGPVSKYFPLDTSSTPPPDDTFEIGLVLGGTVSAAAYTAGVLDFLIEALDAWTVARQAGQAPEHKVIIKIMSGTSGGAISCTLLSRILRYAFFHVTADAAPSDYGSSPLYDCWVNQIDISDMLKLTDLKPGTPSSLLCATKIDFMDDRIANFPCAGSPDPYPVQPLGQAGTPPVRDYFEQLLPVVITMTNLRGIPYATNFSSIDRPEYYTDHADHARFVVDITGGNPPTKLSPIEIGVSEKGGAKQAWTTMIKAARCSSAFPVGLPPQAFARELSHYRYRFAVHEDLEVDPSTGKTIAVSKADWLKPAWPYMPPVPGTKPPLYEFLTVDGGCLNNEPTEYCRQHLAGILGHNERNGERAHRAVLLVDPFAETPVPGLDKDHGIFKTASATLTSFIASARYQTADLELFQDETVFSRFLITPSRITNGKELTGGDAIATSCVGAFGGFFSKAYRHHDFMLGRRNCQKFLTTSFMLPRGNKLFDKWRGKTYASWTSDDPDFLPIIPVIGVLRTEITQPDWPKDRFKPESLRPALGGRLNALTAGAAQALSLIPDWIPAFCAKPIIALVGRKLVDKAIAAITTSLQSANLLTRR